MLQQTNRNKSKSGSNLILTANEIAVAYNDYGEGVIPIIFIHGFPFNKNMWWPQIEELSKSHRVIAYDIRGYGTTSTSNEDFSITLFADDLVHLMDILMIDKAVVCGLSMGGYIALNAMQRYSNRFAGLILCDTQCSADTAEGKEKRYNSIKEIESNGISGFIDGMIKNLFAESTYQTYPALIDEIKHIMLAASSLSITNTLNALAERWETCSVLQEIAVPTLIICGKEDKITPPEKSEYMNQHIKKSELIIIENAGHLSSLEQAAEVNDHITRFIASINK